MLECGMKALDRGSSTREVLVTYMKMCDVQGRQPITVQCLTWRTLFGKAVPGGWALGSDSW